MVIRWEVRGKGRERGNRVVLEWILLEFCYKDCGIFVFGSGRILGECRWDGCR